MKDLVLHINFLIQQHDCVIIPDFGGFVLNRESARVVDGRICSPRFFIGFNQDLKYNDGLIAESYMNTYSMSYDVAYKKIVQAVQELESYLRKNKSIDLNNLGSIKIGSYGEFIFTPQTRSFAHPSVFGYSDVNIVRLSDIPQMSTPSLSTRKLVIRRVLRTTGSVAAATLLFFLSSTSITENSALSQQAGFFTELGSNPSYISGVDLHQQLVANINNKDVKLETPLVVNDEPLAKQVAESKTVVDGKVLSQKDDLRYFIIVGSETDRTRANKILERIKAKGFQSAAIVESSGKLRIYVLAFSDKEEANKSLVNFRTQNPDHKDAWLYCKK